eukprot:14789257-Alexandrium_andersonii.AAC.1
MRGIPAIKHVLSTGGSWAKSPIKSTPMPPKGPTASGGGHRNRQRQRTRATCCVRRLTTSSGAIPQ